jgi:hypothetical protein
MKASSVLLSMAATVVRVTPVLVAYLNMNGYVAQVLAPARPLVTAFA